MLITTFDPVHSEIGTEGVIWFENVLPGTAEKCNIEAYARLRTTIYSKINWADDTVTKYFPEDVSLVTENQFEVVNENLCQKLRDFLQFHDVYVLKVKNIHIYTASAQIVNEYLDSHVKGKGTVFVFESLRITSDAQTLTNKGIKSIPAHCSTNSRSSKYTMTSHLFKTYSDNNNKYTADPTDDFSQNSPMFVEHCEQAETEHEEDRRKAFSIVLSGVAQTYYFQKLKPKNLNLVSLLNEIVDRF